MAIQTKTVAEFVTAIETNAIVDVLAALKKPGADRVIMIVRLSNSAFSFYGLEVWDVG